MEYLNRIELKGHIGNVRISKVGDRRCANISVCTEHVSSSSEGLPIVETTWLPCIVWEGLQIANVEDLKTKLACHIEGRLRGRTYTDIDDRTRTYYEVAVSKFEIINQD